MASTHLIVGGARSGKSRFAVSSQPPGARVAFVATAQARDADMAGRIERHRADRPGGWLTVEEPTALAPALKRLVGRADAIVVDCLTLWVSNRLLGGDDEPAILAEADEIAALARGGHWDLTFVSNEVGLGVHPETADGLRFRDLLGLVNQRLAAACDRVTLMVAGLPITLKALARAHDIAPEAP
ncbi:MAG: bifunctional adenosylcobinamide kinase/adenosylcobinamide-phosphate guanylyltransferase [Candidatus Rokuibacteriota bacterium]